jgi:hypothetical protein
MSISPAHSEAARRNGASSNGPVTDAGKFRSSQNAAKHHLFAATNLLSPEDRLHFDELTSAFLGEYEPETPTESRFLREMIDAEWRLQRVRAHSASIQESRMRKISETPTLDDAAEAFRQLAAEGPTLSLLARYETQFRRQFDKSLKLLLDVRLRLRADPERIQLALVREQLRFINEYVNTPMPGAIQQDNCDQPEPQPDPQPDPQPEHADPVEPENAAGAPAQASAAVSAGSSNSNLQNEPSAAPPPPRRFTNIFKRRGSRKRNR